jgi:hypothetical protein
MGICLDCAIHFTRSGVFNSGNYGYFGTAILTSFSEWKKRKIGLKPALILGYSQPEGGKWGNS